MAWVLLFVIIGRSAHHHGVTWSGVASTTWPFATGLVIGWFIVFLGRRDMTSLSSGGVVVLSTVVVGMILRVVAGQGTAVAFIVVALSFLGLTLIGWRMLFSFVSKHRSKS